MCLTTVVAFHLLSTSGKFMSVSHFENGI